MSKVTFPCIGTEQTRSENPEGRSKHRKTEVKDQNRKTARYIFRLVSPVVITARSFSL